MLVCMCMVWTSLNEFKGMLKDLYSTVCYRALFGHWEDNPNCLYFVGLGCDGLEEMVDSLMDSQMMYALGKAKGSVMVD